MDLYLLREPRTPPIRSVGRKVGKTVGGDVGTSVGLEVGFDMGFDIGIGVASLVGLFAMTGGDGIPRVFITFLPSIPIIVLMRFMLPPRRLRPAPPPFGLRPFLGFIFFFFSMPVCTFVAVMGALVGRRLGLDMGLDVGFLVGLKVGRGVGLRVGDDDGLNVGLSVG